MKTIFSSYHSEQVSLAETLLNQGDSLFRRIISVSSEIKKEKNMRHPAEIAWEAQKSVSEMHEHFIEIISVPNRVGKECNDQADVNQNMYDLHENMKGFSIHLEKLHELLYEIVNCTHSLV